MSEQPSPETYLQKRLMELRAIREELERRAAVEHAALSGAIQEIESLLAWYQQPQD